MTLRVLGSIAIEPEQKTNPFVVTTACGKIWGIGFGALAVSTPLCVASAILVFFDAGSLCFLRALLYHRFTVQSILADWK